MIYLLFFLIVVIIINLVSTQVFKKRQRRKQTKISNQWGKLKEEHFNFDRIGFYLDFNTEENFHRLTKQTKNDVDFNEVFSYIDRTTSNVGQQFLYNALSKPTNDIASLKSINEQAEFFQNNPIIRNEVQQLLDRLATKDAYYIATLFSNNFPEQPIWFKFLGIYIVAILSCIVLSKWYPFLLIWLMIPLALNVFIHYRNKNYTERFNQAFPQLNILISVCKKLLLKKIITDKTNVQQSIDHLKSIQNKSKLLGYNDSTFTDELTEFALMMFTVIKAFFLIEVITFYNLVKEVQKKHAAILTLFKYVGAIDIALSIASLRSGGALTCVPVFLPADKKYNAKNLYHPLIDNCVTNDIFIKGKSVLITGSNMSGKSTFLRTLAINAILAQTIVTCFADKYETPIFKLHSSIRIADNLLDAKSYYFEEVTVMGALINEAKERWQNIFILDEVFKGTNTIERIASAKAILSFLNKNNNIVFVATHDTELSALLADGYDLYHFAESLENDQFSFDHKLKVGNLKTRNAIKILELYNYPIEIVEEAKRISLSLSLNNKL